ncbi:hypothetical protein OM960_18610 [Defluviimonas sp. CAU 1641]|uniref:Uncharacterized protein n=1 Tax=Defluviimonas salinarum TaxID=2992147 RepID=A0ABT3J7D4_9RHOB|nr:hypothetical protein [Defluviimonas salinarum]
MEYIVIPLVVLAIVLTSMVFAFLAIDNKKHDPLVYLTMAAGLVTIGCALAFLAEYWETKAWLTYIDSETPHRVLREEEIHEIHPQWRDALAGNLYGKPGGVRLACIANFDGSFESVLMRADGERDPLFDRRASAACARLGA